MLSWNGDRRIPDIEYRAEGWFVHEAIGYWLPTIGRRTLASLRVPSRICCWSVPP
jgi:hypothetical protein